MEKTLICYPNKSVQGDYHFKHTFCNSVFSKHSAHVLVLLHMYMKYIVIQFKDSQLSAFYP